MKEDPTRDPASEARDDWASERMTDRELQLAKQAAAKILRDQAQGLSDADRELLRKYPKHSLEQAREIEATGRESWDGYTSGFDKLLAQERGCKPLSGDHT